MKNNNPDVQRSTCRDVQRLTTKTQEAWADLQRRLFAKGVHVVVIETLRTPERQEWLLAKGASKVKHSRHQDGVAIDIMLDLTKHNGLGGAWDTTTKRGRALFFTFGEEAERQQTLSDGTVCHFRWGGRFNPKGGGDLPKGQRDQLGWDAGHIELVEVSS